MKNIMQYITQWYIFCFFSLRELKGRFSRKKLSIKMKNIISLDVAAIKTICQSSWKVLYNLNKNIKVKTTFNFRKWRQEKNYSQTHNFNIITIIFSNILFCNYSFIFLTLTTRTWAPWKQESYNKKLTVLCHVHIILCIIHIQFIVLGLVSKKMYHGYISKLLGKLLKYHLIIKSRRYYKKYKCNFYISGTSNFFLW